jgi:hypothetical protein
MMKLRIEFEVELTAEETQALSEVVADRRGAALLGKADLEDRLGRCARLGVKRTLELAKEEAERLR